MNKHTGMFKASILIFHTCFWTYLIFIQDVYLLDDFLAKQIFFFYLYETLDKQVLQSYTTASIFVDICWYKNTVFKSDI